MKYLFLLFIFLGSVYADVIELQSSVKLEGTILAETDTFYIIKIDKEQQKVMKTDIVNVVKEETIKEDDSEKKKQTKSIRGIIDSIFVVEKKWKEEREKGVLREENKMNELQNERGCVGG